MLSNESENRRKLQLLSAIMIITGYLILYAVFQITSNSEKHNISQEADEVLEFLQSSCQKYDDYQLGNQVENLQNLQLKAENLCRYLNDIVLSSNDQLAQFEEDQSLTGIWILDADLNTEYYDLGLEHRNETDDQVTVDSANATKKYGVAVKCATITPNAARMTEYHLKEMWKSPNGTIRAMLDGTVFRAPIIVKGIEPCVKNWKKPITIARHAYGDVYKASEMKIPGPGKCELVYTAEDGTETRELIHNFTGAGVVQGQHNLCNSIESFARSCFNYALDTKQDLWFATKDTISKKYDHTFKDIFQEIFDSEYAQKFKDAGITYFYTLIDDAVARVMKSEGGYIWACKNYDGDVMSDMVSSAFGSLAMMTSVLVTPDGKYEYEAAHGTVQRHYYKHLKGEETSTNSVATIFAWTGALRKRGELDGSHELEEFADKLEKACVKTIEDGKMTKDLALITTIPNPVVLNSEDFIKAIRSTLEGMLLL